MKEHFETNKWQQVQRNIIQALCRFFVRACATMTLQQLLKTTKKLLLAEKAVKQNIEKLVLFPYK